MLQLGHDRKSEGCAVFPPLTVHAWAAMTPDMLNIAAADAVMPVVPMFHVNAWGIPYAAAMAGAKLVMPGARWMVRAFMR